MITVPIYIIDTAETIEDKLGLAPKRKPVLVVKFNFAENAFDAFWMDPEVNDDTGTIDIVFYIRGQEFRTIYNSATFARFVKLMEQ